MTTAPAKIQSEGLKTARLLMVLSSVSPLFILWAIRGNSLIPDHYFISLLHADGPAAQCFPVAAYRHGQTE